ncbi:CPBP family intramembrane glutamic endopeptidase [Caldicellulosiruptor sp. DIB 104C]|uniref:CPBP family intramembrane glutamic endopeptidase n=1 Tax=Caldicellulosiruptor sp. DIB 104C TaxID=3019889 RepID=UPI002305570D|nr:type II CAAX endopeptidase family protein [Caldicellulosiruptor sp. DIB 104C]
MISSTLKEVVKYIGLLVLSTIVMAVITFIFNNDKSENIISPIIYYIGTFLLFLVFTTISLKRRKINILEICNFRKITFKDAVFTIVLATAYSFVISAIYTILDSKGIITPFREEYENSMQRFIDNTKTELVIFAIVIAAPFFEELMFRGLIFGTMLRNQINIFLAVTVQALLFGLFHFDLYQGMDAFFAGIFSAFVLYCTNSIWNSIIFHAVSNSFGLISLVYNINESTESYLPIMYYIFMLLIGIILMYAPMRYFFRRKSEIKN